MTALKEPKYGRKDRMIEDVETGQIKQFDSINKAKKESVKLQLSNDGALGRGSVRRHG